MRNLLYSQSINEALEAAISKDNKVIVMGLGVDDPKGVFGTTINLKKKFKNNVFDLPTAENASAGIGLGLAISKFKPVIVHQRVEFSLLSFEQIVNQISKWYYMSAGKINVPMVIRLIIGKGWGQGPQHSQSLEAIFSHIPGLKVICPSNSYDAKGMMIESILDPDPVIFFEHRWLHNTKSMVPKKNYRVKIGKAKLLARGDNLTIVSFSYPVLECLKAVKFCKNLGLKIDLIDLRSLRPLDKKTIIKSVKKTKKLLIVDNGMITYGISAEIMSVVTENFETYVKMKRIGVTNPVPSTISLAKYCYPEEDVIINEIFKILNVYKKNYKKIPKKRKFPDQPDQNFVGPF